MDWIQTAILTVVDQTGAHRGGKWRLEDSKAEGPALPGHEWSPVTPLRILPKWQNLYNRFRMSWQPNSPERGRFDCIQILSRI